MADRRPGIGCACPRLTRILTSIAVYLVELFCLHVVGLEVVVADRPGRRNATVVANLTEILFAQAEQSSAVKLRVATDVVVGVGMKVLAFGIEPRFTGVVMRV